MKVELNKIKQIRGKFYGLKDFINYPEVRKRYGKCAFIIAIIIVAQYFMTLIGAEIVRSIDMTKNSLKIKNFVLENEKEEMEITTVPTHRKNNIRKNKIKIIFMNIIKVMIYILVYSVCILKYIPMYKVICKYIKK